ncbi:MAG: hypothetical protein GY710_04005 [Desulfobacteraceae bacterium]|nr:hypothetical protein [Desulfobacteraceae bacterium]
MNPISGKGPLIPQGKYRFRLKTSKTKIKISHKKGSATQPTKEMTQANKAITHKDNTHGGSTEQKSKPAMLDLKNDDDSKEEPVFRPLISMHNALPDIKRPYKASDKPQLSDDDKLDHLLSSEVLNTKPGWQQFKSGLTDFGYDFEEIKTEFVDGYDTLDYSGQELLMELQEDDVNPLNNDTLYQILRVLKTEVDRIELGQQIDRNYAPFAMVDLIDCRGATSQTREAIKQNILLCLQNLCKRQFSEGYNGKETLSTGEFLELVFQSDEESILRQLDFYEKKYNEFWSVMSHEKDIIVEETVESEYPLPVYTKVDDKIFMATTNQRNEHSKTYFFVDTFKDILQHKRWYESLVESFDNAHTDYHYRYGFPSLYGASPKIDTSGLRIKNPLYILTCILDIQHYRQNAGVLHNRKESIYSYNDFIQNNKTLLKYMGKDIGVFNLFAGGQEDYYRLHARQGTEKDREQGLVPKMVLTSKKYSGRGTFGTNDARCFEIKIINDDMMCITFFSKSMHGVSCLGVIDFEDKEVIMKCKVDSKKKEIFVAEKRKHHKEWSNTDDVDQTKTYQEKKLRIEKNKYKYQSHQKKQSYHVVSTKEDTVDEILENEETQLNERGVLPIDIDFKPIKYSKDFSVAYVQASVDRVLQLYNSDWTFYIPGYRMLNPSDTGKDLQSENLEPIMKYTHFKNLKTNKAMTQEQAIHACLLMEGPNVRTKIIDIKEYNDMFSDFNENYSQFRIDQFKIDHRPANDTCSDAESDEQEPYCFTAYQAVHGSHIKDFAISLKPPRDNNGNASGHIMD